MQQLNPTITRVTRPLAAGPADRFRAAIALVYLPNSIYGIVERGAAAAVAAGRQVSAVELVRPYLDQVSPEATRVSLLDAVAGALRVAPEFEAERSALTDAAQGVADVLLRACTDRTQGPAWDVADRLIGELDQITAPLYGVSFRLDPSNA